MGCQRQKIPVVYKLNIITDQQTKAEFLSTFTFIASQNAIGIERESKGALGKRIELGVKTIM